MTQLPRRSKMLFAMLGYVILLIGASTVQAELLATFDGSTEGWQGYEGKVEAVPTPSADDRGALEVAVALSGRGWSDITVESPELNKDFSGWSELRVRVFTPVGLPRDVKAQVFAKSGPGWTWSDAGWQPLSVEQWTDITLPFARIAYPSQVRTVGIKVGGNSQLNGSIFLDRVEISGAAGAAQREISVRIDEIIENSRIIGRVVGIPADRVGDYKVLVYVRTDRWYIHPYERGGEGLSFASINPDGSWRIETVKRRFLADLVAALVVDRKYEAPPAVEALNQIVSVASFREEGKGKL